MPEIKKFGPMLWNLGETTLETTYPELIATDRTTLRFALIFKAGNDTVGEIAGFRVKEGKLLPPARRMPNGKYIPTINLGDRIYEVIKNSMNLWAEEFPTVVFPKGEIS